MTLSEFELTRVDPIRLRWAWPVAWLVIEPAFRSACVIVWLAVQVTDAPGASAIGVFGQLTVTLSSVTVNDR